MSAQRNRIAMIALSIAAPLAVACAHDPTKELVAARSAYEDAQKGAANELAPAEVYEAGKALAAAERAHDDKPGSDKERDLAYVAHRKAELAAAKAEQSIAQEDRQNAKQTYVAALEESQRENQAHMQALDATQRALGEERNRRADLQQELDEAVSSFDELAKMQQDNGRTVITLDGSVLFTSDSAKLLAPAASKLQKVADVIKEYEDNYHITIEGHTDSRGSSKHNHDLSEQRAQAVREFLVGHGVKPDVVDAVGKGEDAPVAPNTTPEGRADNRRVELVIEPTDEGEGAKSKSDERGDRRSKRSKKSKGKD